MFYCSSNITKFYMVAASPPASGVTGVSAVVGQLHSVSLYQIDPLVILPYMNRLN